MPTTDDKECPYNPLCGVAKVKFEEMDKRINARIDAFEFAIQKSEDTINIRLDSMNEYRQQLTDERMDYTTRREAILLNLIISLIVAALAVFVAHLVNG